MRPILWLFPALLFALQGCAEGRHFDALPPDAVVLAFGDSVTAGVGADAGYDYPSQLAESTGLNVVNAGVSGDTAREAANRLAPLLASHQPQLVIVELGGNDFLRQTQAVRVKAFLRDIIRESLASGATVVLVAVPRLSLLRASVGALSDSPIYAELAAEEGVVLVPDIFSAVLSDSDLRADEIHPNARGYGQLAQGIEAVLTERGLLTD
tara:strand:+ start:19767 stop:20396 length:630 start_codon:yes stop_codon:yes gene_type:complete